MANDLGTDRILESMRHMAWERAKGELNGILYTYYGYDNFEDIDERIKDFIEYIEDNHIG